MIPLNMKLSFLAALAALLIYFPLQSFSNDTPAELPLAYGEVTLINLTGEILQLSTDDQSAVDITDSITIKVTPGEHDFIIRDPSGDELPRHATIEAGQGYTWTVVRAPDQK